MIMHLNDHNINFDELLLHLRDLNICYGGKEDERKIALTILNDERFPIWSGASKPEQHHYGKHGLLLHTYEVIRLCLDVNVTMGTKVDKRELYYSALFHDAGKMFDYIPTNPEQTDWHRP